MGSKRTDRHTPFELDFIEYRECLWHTKPEHYRNKTVRENAMKVTVQKLNVPELTVTGCKTENQNTSF
jgi:hypothetical protein